MNWENRNDSKKACEPVLQDYVELNREKGLPGREVLTFVKNRLAENEKGKFGSKYMEK